jgi:hypothetical protein
MTIVRGALAWLMVLTAFGLPAACGGRSETPSGGMCQSIAWGGWNGTPDCAGIASSVVQGADRACQQHSDYALVAASSCSAHAVNNAAAERYRGFPPPCNHPLAGMCAPQQWYPVCQQGCCVPSNQPPPPNGFTPQPGY